MGELKRYLEDKALDIIVAGVVVSLLLNAYTSLVHNDPGTLAISVVVFLVIIVTVRAAWRKYRRRIPDVGAHTAFQVPRKAVIFTLGLNSHRPGSVVEIVKDKLKPEWVGLLATSQLTANGVVDGVKKLLSLPEDHVKVKEMDATDIAEGKAETGLLIAWMRAQGLSGTDIVVDLTGGTATMTVAAYMAAEANNVDAEYIYSEYDREKQAIVPKSQRPILVTHYQE